MTTQNCNTAIFLPGRGARLDSRLGRELTRRGYAVEGRSLHDGFEALSYVEQVSLIREDLTERHWTRDSVLVAHSYGGHLALSALAELPPYPGTLALVSPAFRAVRRGCHYYRVPGAKRLAASIDGGVFPCPTGRVGIVSGLHDWQVPTDGLERLAQAMGVAVSWAERGHDLGPEPVQGLLDRLAI